jgi:glucose-6-phosphate isomerase
LGGDILAFVRGAKEMDTACQNANLEENPGALLAAVQFLLDTKRKYLIRVIMPYSTRLQSLGRWEQQLLAESLGKTEAYGPSPLAGIGTQDQHSMLQQWIQGRRVTWHLFIREQEKERVIIPDVPVEELGYLSGKSLGQVLEALAEGTAQSLTVAKRPHATITLPMLDEEHLGQLFFLFMVEVVLLGKLYRVDPYGQPGVEIGKKIAKKILSGEEKD